MCNAAIKYSLMSLPFQICDLILENDFNLKFSVSEYLFEFMKVIGELFHGLFANRSFLGNLILSGLISA